MKKILLLIFPVLMGWNISNAQNCPYDNTFYVDLTPMAAGATANNTCINAGDIVTVNVILGETYIFSTCATTGVDVVLTLYTGGGGAILATDDDGCGPVAGAATITWVAIYTGVVDLLIDEFMCVHATNCITLDVTRVSSCTDPDVPTPTANINNVCPSTDVTLDWAGASLNDATNWHIYTGSCGVTQLTSQAGTSLVVSPATTTTYYIRGEDGAGCVDESTGACGQVTVTVDQTSSTLTSATASTNNVCPSTSVSLTANGLATGSGATFNWYTGSGGTGTNLGSSNPLSVSPATTTVYYAYVTGTCNTLEESITVTVQTAIDVTVTNASPMLTANQAGATYQWLDCDNSNAVIATETNQSYTATANGNYAVEITVGSCIDTSACENINTLSINESSFGKNIQLFPNPTNGNITISNIKPSITTISIVDVTGKEVYSLSNINKSKVQISLTDFNKGIYFVKLTDSQQQKVIKLINR